MTATATLIVFFSTGITLTTIRVYERMLREQRARADRAEEHAEQAQGLLSASRRHPSGRGIPTLTLVEGTGGTAS